jgi:hypothetical protein
MLSSIGIGSVVLPPGNDSETGNACCYQHSVLIDNVEGVDDIKVVPSPVRFQFLSDAHRFVAGTLYFSFNFGFVFLGAFDNRKFGKSTGGLIVGKNELPREMVKRGSKVMNDLADNDAPMPRQLEIPVKSKDFISRLRIVLGSDRIMIGTPEAVDLGFKVTDVLFGPLDLNYGRE